MKTRNRVTRWIATGAALSVLAISTLLSSVEGQAAQNQQIECASRSTHVKTVALSEARATNFTYNSNPGNFDPTPLLKTTITVARPSCLVAHFSAMAQPQDNSAMFQVRVDGVPMEGHAPGATGINVPVVYDPEETNFNLPRMVAYNFFQEVQPGEHTVEVLFAGCCSALPNASGLTVANAVLTLEYIGK